MEQLLNRRSCRKFVRNQKVPHSDIEKIVEAARNYPCSLGNQNVDFLVITNQDVIDKISDGVANACPEFKKYLERRKETYNLESTIWSDAPLVIFGIYNDRNANRAESNCGAAMASIIDAAVDLGYATLPVLMASNSPQNKVTSEVLGIEPERLGLSIAIGKMDDSFVPDKKEIKSQVHWIE